MRRDWMAEGLHPYIGTTMSKPNLPPMPNELWATLDAEQEDQVYAYAEEAVRQALAAQVPVAWLREVSCGGGVWNRHVSLWEPPSGFISIDRKFPLALLPEKDHGEST